MEELTWSGAEILDAAVVDSGLGNLLMLGGNGALTVLDTATGVTTPLGTVPLPEIQWAPPDEYFPTMRWRLHASSDARFVAIVCDAGTEGVVFDTQSQRVTLHLHAEDYYSETVPFSVCFLTHRGRDLLVHRTAWNRLDVSDPADGRPLTHRASPRYEPGAAKNHYLDYFHGQLLPNPSYTRIVDDGWVWGPAAVTHSWSTDAWLTGNSWESEDGPSLRKVLVRDDWNMPMCWVDSDHLATWGLSMWDLDASEDIGDALGIRILDVRTEDRLTDVTIPMPGTANTIFSDGDTVYVAADTGTSGWSIATATQNVTFPEFTATLYDPNRHELLAVTSHGITRQPI